MNDPYILKKGHYPFVIWKLESDSKPIVDNQDFAKKNMLAYRMTLIVSPLAGISEDDVLNPELAEPEAARVIVYMAIQDAEGDKPAKAWNGGPKAGNKLVVMQAQGRDVLRADVFHAMIEASGVDLSILGDAQPISGLPKIREIYLKVDALPGSGQYAAKNVFRAWAKDKATFEAETAQANKALLDTAKALAAAPKNADGTAISPLAATLKAGEKPETKAPVTKLAPSKGKKDPEKA